tara:strand:+ start:4040 stop:5437 length:1398 start_codon:yes stop_codon:yes gene_type:complete
MANKAKFGSSNKKSIQKIFGTDGVRGEVGTILTPELSLEIGYLCGRILPSEGPFLIGKDSRISGSMLCASLIAGLTSSGRDVWDIGLCPTPAISFLIRKYKAAGGLMVSASHNPPKDNGIKIFQQDGSKITAEMQSEIESKLFNFYSKNKYKNIVNKFGFDFKRFDLLSDYKEHLISSVEGCDLNNKKIVLDLCWGSATSCGLEVFESLGASIYDLHSKPNGHKINHKCGSTNLKSLRQAVIQSSSDIGFAFDGDADRMIAIDKKGRVIDGDHVLYLWGEHLLGKNKLPNNLLIGTVMSNLGFQRNWEEKGGKLYRTPVGDQNVYQAMVSSGASLGGEPSGHVLFAEHGLSGDGILTALKIASLCTIKGKSISELRDESFTPFPQKLVNLRLSEKANKEDWKECSPIIEALSQAEEAMGDEGRVLIRKSGTEPLLRIMVEAESTELVNTWTSRLKSIVEKYFLMI